MEIASPAQLCHPSIFVLIFIRVTGDLEPIPADFAGHKETHEHTHLHLHRRTISGLLSLWSTNILKWSEVLRIPPEHTHPFHQPLTPNDLSGGLIDSIFSHHSDKQQSFTGRHLPAYKSDTYSSDVDYPTRSSCAPGGDTSHWGDRSDRRLLFTSSLLTS